MLTQDQCWEGLEVGGGEAFSVLRLQPEKVGVPGPAPVCCPVAISLLCPFKPDFQQTDML